MKKLELKEGIHLVSNKFASGLLMVSVEGTVPFLKIKSVIDMIEFKDGKIVPFDETNERVKDFIVNIEDYDVIQVIHDELPSKEQVVISSIIGETVKPQKKQKRIIEAATNEVENDEVTVIKNENIEYDKSEFKPDLYHSFVRSGKTPTELIIEIINKEKVDYNTAEELKTLVMETLINKK